MATGAAALLSGCADPWPVDEAEAGWPPIGQFVEAEGLRIHYWEAGQGEPVVLVHGASGNLRDWTFDIAPLLAQKYRVIAVDRPGFGYSERPPEDGSDASVQARILRTATKSIGAERPVVIGHSWGGALSLAWAVDEPDSLRGIVPVSAVAMPYGGLGRFLSAIGLSSVIASLYSEYLKSSAANGGIEKFIARVFRPQSPPVGYVDYVGGPLALRDATLDANAKDIEDLPVALRRIAPAYPELKLPVEIVHGMSDFVGHERHAIPLSEVVPQARLTLLPGVGHMAHHAAPAVLMEAVDRIVAQRA